ncbi:hypothetical protein DOTSEDRAFT_56905 [Dothistroma septosporum NZE10]|uniref:PEBP-like protein n=1 Tax=Dothistroma septosporum (strain NZE10 / CBS 128990) TaxID=675120 RepID=M2XJC5_DOTSN|nr:hypothetical protein DOTSEDRAFT_56905 [Dothistroma septosporum NZE10]
MQYQKQVAAVFSLLVAQGTCQTPAGTAPITDKHLNIAYGDTVVEASDLLPQALVQSAPNAWLSRTVSGDHMLLLVDQSIPQSSINSTGPQAPGLEYCRTTRLHWFQTDLNQLDNGCLVSETAPIAMYGGPMPGINDIAHTYVFYLFAQPSNFSLDAATWDAGGKYDPISVYDRMNFSTFAISAIPGVGHPIAANYMRVQNPDTTAYGTAPNGTCPLDSGLSSLTVNTTHTDTPYYHRSWY